MLTFEAKKSIIVLSFLTPLSTVFVGLRLARKQKHLGVDDWVLCFALVLLYLQTAFGVLCKGAVFANVRFGFTSRLILFLSPLSGDQRRRGETDERIDSG